MTLASDVGAKAIADDAVAEISHIRVKLETANGVERILFDPEDLWLDR